MNLTIIKKFFATEKKQIEPTTKIGRVLRRSFRMRRPRHLLEGNREKRKSGKEIINTILENCN